MKKAYIAVLLMLLVAAPLFAVDEHGADPELNGKYWQGQIVKLVNFLVIAFAAYYILRKPVKQFFQKRADQIETDLKQAEIARQEAEQKLKEVEEQVAGINQRVDEILGKARQEAETEKDRILGQAKAEADKIRQTAENEITNRLKAARLELKQFASQLAVEKAREIIRQELKQEDDQALIARSIEEMGGVH